MPGAVSRPAQFSSFDFRNNLIYPDGSIAGLLAHAREQGVVFW
jgi:hypothetical protein